MTKETENRELIVRGRYDLTVPERALIERGLLLAESLGKSQESQKRPKELTPAQEKAKKALKTLLLMRLQQRRALAQKELTPEQLAKAIKILTPGFRKHLEQKGLITRKKDYICPILNAMFVLIPAGTFMMGSPEDYRIVYEEKYYDHTLNQETISKSFYMQMTSVTQGQWKKVMGNNPSYFKGDDNLPVENVSWNDVQEFLVKLNGIEGTNKYRLPTEAEWEYACRAGSTKAFCFGDDPSRLSEYAWYKDNSGDETHPVGRKKPNAWGLYDMHGNVWEWVQGCYGDYPTGFLTELTDPSSGTRRVFRGGSWAHIAGYTRAAFRGLNDPSDRGQNLGFRLARTS